MPRLNNHQRIRTVTQLELGIRVSDIAKELNVSRQEILNLQTKYNVTGSILDLPHLHWSVDQWMKVIWTDETPIHLAVSMQTRYIRTRGGINNRLLLAQPTYHSGGGHVMVWGGVVSMELLFCLRDVFWAL